jgi:hypothetical protein
MNLGTVLMVKGPYGGVGCGFPHLAGRLAFFQAFGIRANLRSKIGVLTYISIDFLKARSYNTSSFWPARKVRSVYYYGHL